DEQRRGLPTTWHAHGDARAVVAGDAAFALAFRIAGDGPPGFADELGATLERLCDGEMLELDRVDTVGSICAVEEIVEKKTGSLFGAAAFLGAAIADAGRAEGCRAAGVALGLAYQLLDDLEDIAPDSVIVGSDLAAALLTSPWLVSFSHEELIDLLANR